MNESDGLHHEFFMNCTDVCFVMDVSGESAFHFRLVNAAVARKTGLPPERFVGHQVQELLPPPQARCLSKQLRACVRSKAPLVAHATLDFPSGQLTWQLSLTPIFDAAGAVVRILGVARDITWNRHFTQHLEQVADWLPGFIYQLHYTGEGEWHFTFVGRRVHEMFGVDAADAMRDSRVLLQRIHPEDYERVMAESLACVEQLRAWHSEFRMIHRDGHALWVEAYDLPQRLEDGSVLTTGYVNDISEQKQLQVRLEHLAQHDPLTGLPNRALLMAHLHQALAMAQRRQGPLSLLFIDLDGFKPVNDTHGHAMGDHLLTAVALRMRARLRESDVLGRLGGDEFLVLLDGTGAEDAFCLGEALCHDLAQPFLLGEVKACISASIGVSSCPEHGTTPEVLLEAADVAMYRAKRAGRNGVMRYDGASTELSETRA